jgi:hypothetical protein
MPHGDECIPMEQTKAEEADVQISVYLLPVRNWKSLLIAVGLAQAKAECSIWFDCWTEKIQLPICQRGSYDRKQHEWTNIITSSKGTCMWPESARKALGDEAFRYEIDDANEWSNAVVSKAYIIRIQCRFGWKNTIKKINCSNMLWRTLRWYVFGISHCQVLSILWCIGASLSINRCARGLSMRLVCCSWGKNLPHAVL